MRHRSHIIMLLCCLVLTLFIKQVSFAQDNKLVQGSHKVYEFKLHYKKDSVSLNKAYMGNAEQLNQLEWFIKHVPQLGDSIIIYSYSSPEGPFWNNARLAKERGETARKYLKSLFANRTLANCVIFVNPAAENWEGLRNLVESNYTHPDKNKVLDVITSNLPSHIKKSRLKKVSNGHAWLYIMENYMPQLRYATWIGKWQDPMNKLEVLPEVEHNITTKAVEQIVEPAIVMQPIKLDNAFKKIETKTVIALKTNVLYDLATVLNFAVEVPFNKNFSILYEQHFPWWLTESNKFCIQHLSFGGEFRWWFLPKTKEATAKLAKRDALVGHFLGLHGWGGKGDIQIGRKFGCYQYEFWSAGLTYGYAMPLSKHLNVEFAISVGYANIPYRHYIPTEDWEILIKDPKKVGTLHYFGPTKVQVNLVVPIRMKRGGAR